jgi:hypothetical protein
MASQRWWGLLSMSGSFVRCVDPAPYRFGMLDPRPGEAAAAGNAPLLGECTLGIEVTRPDLAARCGLGNIDPQHVPGGGDRAAIEVALDWPLPAAGSFLVTIRPDLDSLGAMAVLAMRTQEQPIGAAAAQRIAMIATADRHDRGPWPGPRSLTALLADEAPLAAIALAVADHRRDLGERVTMVRRWIDTGDEPASYREQFAASRRDLAAALASGAVRLRHICGGQIALVITERHEGLQLGYCLSPVVVALNPVFRLQGGPPYRKFTVAQYRAGYADLAAAVQTLAGLEPGWGGSPTIIGSPQGAGSTLSLCAVARIVRQSMS